jgi:NADPH-dependent glutamate synthase beta subunit-like oxidoreductase/NAD(P)H-flavin reductase
VSPDLTNPILGIEGFRYADLYDHQRLQQLALHFDRAVAEHDGELFGRFDAYRLAMQQGTAHGGLTEPQEAELLIAVAKELGVFVATLFQVDADANAIRTRAQRDSTIARFKKEFVTKRITKVQQPTTDEERLDVLDRIAELLVHTLAGSVADRDPELALAMTAHKLVDLERDYPRNLAAGTPPSPSAEARAAFEQLRERLRNAPGAGDLFSGYVTQRDRGGLGSSNPEALTREANAVHELADAIVEWAAARWKRPTAKWKLSEWTAFRLPHTLHFDHLVPTERIDDHRVQGEHDHLRRRDGFALTDPRFTPRQITDEAHYCIFCHERKKDSCSHGFVEKSGTLKPNPLGMPLAGCPLDEKIGQMNALRADGESIGGLAMVMIDNPMCPGTGHRICNDCMRSCIFQKQTPVNIPQIETGVLTDVLFLPWGFEIYSLFTRWNPLHVLRPMALPYNGRNVLVVGLGPAGYTLAHYLANEGFGVVAVDALKVEPLDEKWIGSEDSAPLPIRDARATLWEQLDERILAGFGGVSEYGITVRWDKNFLKVIRIALERKRNVKTYGGIRFGGTVTMQEAFDELDFDHIAIAAGAGTPTIVRMKNNLIRGIRKASDFLMALQLNGAFKKDSLANLQVRLPAVVIGGGLTAIDTATELFAYYPVQVEKVIGRYELMAEELGEEVVRSGYDLEELAILDEFLEHGRAVRAERRRASAAGEKPNFVPLVRKWGGVTIAYRKSMVDSPAYRLNYEEVEAALQEGIAYSENLSPAEALQDEFGHLKSVLFEKQVVEDGRWKDSGEIVELPARSLMVAAGTAPNTIYEREYPGTFKLDRWNQYFQSHTVSLHGDSPELIEQSDERLDGFFTSFQHPSRREKLVTFYGDNHPHYAGNVVKAMASAKHGYPHVQALFARELMAMDRSVEAQQTRDAKWSAVTSKIDEAFLARVHQVNRLTPTIIEVIVKAPFAARRFEPGQFYRLQNFESTAPRIDGTPLVIEGLALTGAWTDPEQGLLSMIILEMGSSSRLCAMLQPGEPVVVMGPTGTPTEIPSNETVLLAGGGLGNAVLFSIARALRNNGCKVVYFAGYRRSIDVFKQDDIESGTDQVVWAVDAGESIPARREQDLSFVGNIVQAMHAYASGEIVQRPENGGKEHVTLTDLRGVTRLIAIGSDGMMRAVKDSRRGVLAPYLNPDHEAVGSINSPMQCMMKQICAQCLQRHVDPITGKESFVFSCFNQDQNLDSVDFVNLRARLRQNTVLEKMSNLWLTRLLNRRELELAEV